MNRTGLQPKPGHFSEPEHTTLGADLQQIREYLLRVAVKASNLYGARSEAARKAAAAYLAVDGLRSELDARLRAETDPVVYRGANMDTTYYPGPDER